MSIRFIQTYNIQSHKGDGNIIELPETGVVQLSGDNNDGKSVITKVMDAAIRQRLKDSDVRKALITRGYESGYLRVVKYNGDELLVNISRAASETFIQTTTNGQTVQRTLSMGGLKDLINEFGFHYNEKRDISLNIYNTYDPLLMVTTSGVVNLDLIKSATQDSKATRALENIRIVRKEVKEARDAYKGRLGQLEGMLATVVEYDTEKERLVLEEAIMLVEDVKILANPPMPPTFQDDSFLKDLLLLYPPSNIDSLMNELILPDEDLMSDLELLYSITKLTDLKEEIVNMYEIAVAVEKAICPTCERPHVMEGVELCRTVQEPVALQGY